MAPHRASGISLLRLRIPAIATTVALAGGGCLASIDESRIGRQGTDGRSGAQDGARDGARDARRDSPGRDGSSETIAPADGQLAETPLHPDAARDASVRRDASPDSAPPPDIGPKRDSAVIAWTRSTTNTTSTLRGLWGTSTGKLWAAGSGGAIIYYDGTKWQTIVSTGTTHDLRAVWGSGPSDVWAVGGAGTIVHFNGSSWKAVSSPVTTQLSGVWGSSSTDVWAAGDGGVILHYQSGKWTQVSQTLTTSPLRGIWASGAKDVWICGSNSILLHDDGSGWKKVPIGSVGSLRAIFGASASAVWTVGHAGPSSSVHPISMAYKGLAWSSVTVTRKTGVLRDVWPMGATTAWAVGYDGSSSTSYQSIAMYYNGSSWIDHSPKGSARMYVIWGDCKRNLLWIGGSDGVVYHRPCR